uniref:Uncharacterized protein n=1 Tax=Anopheles dirus TaxID=7168 RepID=A0A182NTM7_9DIPT
MQQPKLIPLKDRRKVMAKSQDLISAALNILYTKPDTQPLIDVFRDTQSKLQRIFIFSYSGRTYPSAFAKKKQ